MNLIHSICLLPQCLILLHIPSFSGLLACCTDTMLTIVWKFQQHIMVYLWQCWVEHECPTLPQPKAGHSIFFIVSLILCHWSRRIFTSPYGRMYAWQVHTAWETTRLNVACNAMEVTRCCGLYGVLERSVGVLSFMFAWPGESVLFNNAQLRPRAVYFLHVVRDTSLVLGFFFESRTNGRPDEGQCGTQEN